LPPSDPPHLSRQSRPQAPQPIGDALAQPTTASHVPPSHEPSDADVTSVEYASHTPAQSTALAPIDANSNQIALVPVSVLASIYSQGVLFQRFAARNMRMHTLNFLLNVSNAERYRRLADEHVLIRRDLADGYRQLSELRQSMLQQNELVSSLEGAVDSLQETVILQSEELQRQDEQLREQHQHLSIQDATLTTQSRHLDSLEHSVQRQREHVRHQYIMFLPLVVFFFFLLLMEFK
jgi:hypothetical protein